MTAESHLRAKTLESAGVTSIVTAHLYFLKSLYNMSKTQLIAHLASKLGISKRLANDAINVLVDGIILTVKKGGEVRIQGFGTFKSSKRAARMGVNPRNPVQKIKIPAMKVVSFKAGSDFKKAVR